MMDLVTPLYAAIMGLLLFVLSVRTIRLRRRFKVAIGPGEELLLAKAIRAHANLAEYAPLALLLVFFAELQTDTAILIHGLCLMLTVGRLLHAYGVSQLNEDFRFRVTGMALTFTVIVSAALILVAKQLM